MQNLPLLISFIIALVFILDNFKYTKNSFLGLSKVELKKPSKISIKNLVF